MNRRPDPPRDQRWAHAQQLGFAIANAYTAPLNYLVSQGLVETSANKATPWATLDLLRTMTPGQAFALRHEVRDGLGI